MKKFFILFLFLLAFGAQAADLKALNALFQQNYNNYYQPRFCGKNVARLIKEAAKRNIDLSNSYVLKIEGAGFLETSAFYTRTAPQERAMLGYFHYVLVADNYVFDFDLYEPLVLGLQDYIRLQFTPAYQPYVVYGMTFDPIKEFRWWTASVFELNNYISSAPQAAWSKKLSEIVDPKELMKLQRVR